jgi:hypothetical protein
MAHTLARTCGSYADLPWFRKQDANSTREQGNRAFQRNLKFCVSAQPHDAHGRGYPGNPGKSRKMWRKWAVRPNEVGPHSPFSLGLSAWLSSNDFAAKNGWRGKLSFPRHPFFGNF